MIIGFYVTAGWVMSMRPSSLNIKEFVLKKWRQLGKPYLYWTGIILAFDAILWICGYYDNYFIAREIYKSVTLRGIGTLWFLPALGGGSVIFYYLKCKSKLLLIIVIILSIVYLYLYQALFGSYVAEADSTSAMRILDSPFRAVSSILRAWIGVAIGYYAYKFSVRILNESLLIFTIGMLLLIIDILLVVYCPIALSLTLLHVCYIGPLALLYIAYGLQQVNDSYCLRYLDYWGQNSLNLMVTHYSITLVFLRIVVENVWGKPFDGWITLLAFVLSLPIQHFLVHVIEKYAKQTLGK
jgi:hypothetical protein